MGTLKSKGMVKYEWCRYHP